MDDLFAAPVEHHSLFFALVPDPTGLSGLRAARQALEAELPAQRGPGVADERLHLTLHWLGEWSQLPQAVVDDARVAAAEVRQPPFELRLDQAGCFGRGEAIWVLQPSAPPPALVGLHQDLAQALARHRLRLPPGPAFAPHVTLRRRATARFPARAVPPATWTARGFVLLHSLRTAGRTGYQELGRWPLRPPG